MVSTTAHRVEELLGILSEPMRVEFIDNYAAVYRRVPLSGTDRKFAETLFRASLRDASVQVRHSVSEAIKDHPEVPRDIAITLAMDMPDVAASVLRHSPILTDDDLTKFVRAKGVELQVAVANRRVISGNLSESLVNTNDEDVVELVGNRGAKILEPTLIRIIETFSGNEAIMENLSRRPELPLSVVRRLIPIVSNDLRCRLENNYPLSEDAAESLAAIDDDESTLMFLQKADDDAEVESAVQNLYANGRLSHNMVVMGLCMGDLRFFKIAISELLRLPADRVSSLIYDPGPLGLETTKIRIDLSDRLFEVMRMALDVMTEIEYQGGGFDEITRFQDEVIKRLDARFDGAASANLGYLLSRLAHGSTECENANQESNSGERINNLHGQSGR